MAEIASLGFTSVPSELFFMLSKAVFSLLIRMVISVSFSSADICDCIYGTARVSNGMCVVNGKGYRRND